MTKLEKAVCEALSSDPQEALDTLKDVLRGGADAGFNGFCYYEDTVPFFDAHRSEIFAMLRDLAEEFGETPSAMLLGFECLKNIGCKDPMAQLAAGEGENLIQIKNALAWFALEEVARRLTDA
jgi:hypothetical protein